MGVYTKLTDAVLMSDDFISIIKEQTFHIKTFEEFVKEIQKFDERVKALGIETTLDYTLDPVMLKWVVDEGYMNDTNRVLMVTGFTAPGNITCDQNYRFRAPGCVNVNQLAEANQILKHLDQMLYTLEDEHKSNNNQNNQQQDKKQQKDMDDMTPEEKEDANFKLDPAIIKIMDKVAVDGEKLLQKAKSIPAFEYGGKKYKIVDGDLMVSTEKEAIISFDFPRDQEIDIYAETKDGQKLRAALQNYFRKQGLRGDNEVSFRADMDKTPHFYSPVGKLPVKKTTGPEARAMLNYYDGKKVRFQPKENEDDGGILSTLFGGI